MDDKALNDFLNKSNTTSFIFSNGRYLSKSQFGQPSSSLSNLQEQSQVSSLSNQSTPIEQQLSEEIDDDFDTTNEYTSKAHTALTDDHELRTFDDTDYQDMPNSEDEFFLISTPSPFGMNRPGHHYKVIGNQEEINDEDDEDENDEDEIDEYDTHHKPVNMLRYQVQYELNRLSNIIEEEDFNYEDEEDTTEKNDKSEKDEKSEQNEKIEKPETLEVEVEEEFIKTESIEEERESGKSYLDKSGVEGFKEMLKLGGEISEKYSGIKKELDKPVTGYKPVMKKRVYHLNRAYGDREPQLKQVRWLFYFILKILVPNVILICVFLCSIKNIVYDYLNILKEFFNRFTTF